MVKLICLLLVSLSFMSETFSQKNSEAITAVPGRNSFYAEIGGPGILFSANLDRRFKNSNLGWGGRVGLGFVSGYLDTNSQGWYDNPSSVVTIPVQINYIFGKAGTPHTFEVGAGATLLGRKVEVLDFYEKQTNFFATASFMYRRQPVNGGFSWRLGFTPLIAKEYIQAFGGASVGYNF
jgi:hypothetical protein